MSKELLSEIPLEERLVYSPSEHKQWVVIHESIAKIIQSFNPKYLRLIPIESWGMGTVFDLALED